MNIRCLCYIPYLLLHMIRKRLVIKHIKSASCVTEYRNFRIELAIKSQSDLIYALMTKSIRVRYFAVEHCVYVVVFDGTVYVDGGNLRWVSWNIFKLRYYIQKLY